MTLTQLSNTSFSFAPEASSEWPLLPTLLKSFKFPFSFPLSALPELSSCLAHSSVGFSVVHFGSLHSLLFTQLQCHFHLFQGFVTRRVHFLMQLFFQSIFCVVEVEHLKLVILNEQECIGSCFHMVRRPISSFRYLPESLFCMVMYWKAQHLRRSREAKLNLLLQIHFHNS